MNFCSVMAVGREAGERRKLLRMASSVGGAMLTDRRERAREDGTEIPASCGLVQPAAG